ncbi:hypothetical protein BB561_003820 [Smittium simulii]|uniref:WD repeat-containing protein 89 n=1 Tax=Smittium simulii TaxID=133385 RepID=A0A2T9YJG4_9FUNG|nr:hypothetical protein BB561_003820 [Smittium simulii]
MRCVAFQQLPTTNGKIPYINQVSAVADGIIASTSSNNVFLLDNSNLAIKAEIGHHQKQITNTETKKNNFVATSSLDGAVRVWDLRMSTRTPAQELMAPLPLLSFDISCDGNFVIAGSEQAQNFSKKKYMFCNKVLDSEANTAIFFWDVRKPDFELTSFVESHSNDITQIKCHPTNPKQFLSASTDGLACLYNFEKTLEENDAMVSSCNVNISIQQAGYFGPDSNYLFCLSDMNTLSLWYEDSTQISNFDSIINSEQEISSQKSIDYVVSCSFDSNSNNLYLHSGNYDGDVHLSLLYPDRISDETTLSAGHSDIVRSVYWDYVNYKAVTGGEDGRICFWSV